MRRSRAQFDFLIILFLDMSILLAKRHSYMSKSILSILHPTHTTPKLASVPYLISSPILIVLIVTSAWAIVFFAVFGLCYHFRSGVLLEDLNFARLHPLTNVHAFRSEVHRQYSQLSFHCLFCVLLYSVVLFACLGLLHYRERKRSATYRDPK